MYIRCEKTLVAPVNDLVNPPPPALFDHRDGRYRFALQDVRAVLSMPPDQVGSANLSLANGMQHRLNRVVQQLKNSS